MTKLRAPLKRWLDTPLSEPQLQQMWRELSRQSPARARRLPRVVWAAASAAAVLVALVGASLYVPHARSPLGPLAVIGHARLVPGVVLGGDVSSQLDFADGSQIALDPSARLSVLENSGQRIVLHLQRGQGRFEVHPGGPRRWSIECGLATVEVVGTRFSIDRRTDVVRVSVSRGSVLVRSEHVPDHVRRLSTGEALEVRRAPSAAAAPPRRATAAALQSVPVQAAGHKPPPPAAIAADDAALDALLHSADRARRAGRSAEATACLRQVLTRAPGSAYAALAAFSLARMQLEPSPSEAARSLQQALAADLPQSLREDAQADLVEAYARSHQTARAQQAAAAYAARFPGGRRTREVQRWVTPQ